MQATYIYLIKPTVQENDPAYPSIALVNAILRPTYFIGRLVDKIRVQKGLTHALEGGTGEIRTQFPTEYFGFSVQKARTALALDTLRDVFADLVSDSPSKQEIEEAKKVFLSSYVFNFATPQQALEQNMLLAFQRYPSNFYSVFLNNVEKIDRSTVLRTINQHFLFDGFRLLILGDPDLCKAYFQQHPELGIVQESSDFAQ